MQQYLITIAGRQGPPSDVVSYWMWSEPRGDKEGFKVSSDQHAAGVGNVQFQAHSIYMVEHNVPMNVLALDGYLLDGTGPDIMVTGMMNGCSFLMKANINKTQVRCAHIRPPPGPTGAVDLNIRMMNNAQFHGDAGPLTVYGRMSYPSGNSGRSTTVIGVRKAGVWGIYQQQFDGRWNIVSATQIL